MKNFALFFGSLLSIYLLAELIYSGLVVNQTLKRRTIYFTEALDPHGHIHFDSEIGYRMSEIPARYGSIVSDGRLQSMGVLFGNNYGLPDKRTFFPKKPDTTVTRIAVLGDSFTASQFTERGWLDFFQDSLNDGPDQRIELLNFSVDGGGLANWHGIMENIILKDQFEIDGVIYAICCEDLRRTFHYRHEYLKNENGNQMDYRAVGVGYNDGWSTRSYPKSLQDTDMWFSDGWVVMKPEEIDQIENGKWSLKKDWAPYFSIELFEYWLRITESLTTPSTAETVPFTDTAQLNVIRNMEEIHKTLNVSVLCLTLCATNEQIADAVAFSEVIGARHMDVQLPEAESPEIGDSWYIEGDGHWTMLGAEEFARHNHDTIAAWVLSVN